MANFSLKDSGDYYLCLSDQPKRFDADSPVTNVFFDDTNGEVFTVRSGGVTGVTVTSMDDSISTSFTMEDRGPIISIKFSPDHKILAIQRNNENQMATVEFVNFKELVPTNIQYYHTCKWKSAKVLGFVWPRVNEIAFITDHGVELLQVLPEKKVLKSLKNISFSGAWFSWCAQSNTVLLAGNNGALLQPFALNNSTITKLQKLELEAAKPVVERDVFLVRLCGGTWCAVFRHAATAGATPPNRPTEVWLMPITGTIGTQYTHILKTGLVGRFGVNIVDDLVVVHHQSSQTSLLFDILEESNVENNTMIHIPIVPGKSMKPARIGDQECPMYSGNWAVFQPDYIIDARLSCLWQVKLLPMGLATQIPKDELPKLVSVLLRRRQGKPAVCGILHQLISDSRTYLVELSKVFDEINAVYRKWAEQEMSRNTAGYCESVTNEARVLLSQSDVTALLQQHTDLSVQVVTAYLASLSRTDMVVQHPVAELTVRTLVTAGACPRLRSLVRRGCLGDSRPLACQLLSLGHIDPAAAQLALDMMWRLKAYEEVVEVLLGWNEPISAVGAARQAGRGVWGALAARKLLGSARGRPAGFRAVYHALLERNTGARGAPGFLRGEQCDSYVEYYNQLTAEINN